MPPIPESSLTTFRIGRRILHFDCVASTNSLAAEYAADPSADGLVIVAEEQTAGRGKAGSSWICPPGAGLLFSVVLLPPPALRRPATLTVLAAVAVCETVYECTQLQATIKWPNDVLVRGKKVCGILVEQGKGAVIGVGLNINTPASAFAAAGLANAGSLTMFTGNELDRQLVLEKLLRSMDQHYAALLEGDSSNLESAWRWHSGLLGREVSVVASQGTCRGRLTELSFGDIVLRDPDGQDRRFVPESISQIQEVSAATSAGGSRFDY